MIPSDLQCPFCSDNRTIDIADENKDIIEHMIVLKNSSDHIHIHAPMHNKSQIIQFLNHIIMAADIKSNELIFKSIQ